MNDNAKRRDWKVGKMVEGYNDQNDLVRHLLVLCGRDRDIDLIRTAIEEHLAQYKGHAGAIAIARESLRAAFAEKAGDSVLEHKTLSLLSLDS